MIIYKTLNLINGKFYIGKDTKDNPNYFGSGIVLRRAIKKYGKENFMKQTIEVCSTEEELNEREIYWIDKLDARNPEVGYNILKGGEGVFRGEKHPMFNKKHSDESRKKMSESKQGEKNNRYGTHHTIDTKQKMSESQSGEKNHMYGKSHSKETLIKMRGKHKSEEFKTSVRNTMKEIWKKRRKNGK